MKEIHIKELSRIKDDKKFEEKLTSLLVNEEMTFEELMSCCSNKPPLIIKPEILRNIGKKYSKGNDGFKKSPDKAFKLFQYGSEKSDTFCTAACGLYYYDGRAGTVDYPEALKHFLKYYQNAETVNGAVVLKIGIIFLIQEKTKEAVEYLKLILTENENKKTADRLLKAVNENNYLFVLGKMFYDEKNYSTAIKLLLKIKAENNSNESNELINKILNQELLKLYPKTKSEEKEEESIIKKTTKLQVTQKSQKGSSKSKKSSGLNSPGWTKYIKESLVDGYDQSVFSKEIDNLKKRISDYEKLEAKLKKLKKQLIDLKESGAIFSEVNKINEAINSLKEQIQEATEPKKEAESNLAQILYAAQRKELEREYYVQNRFFNPRRTKKSQTRDLAGALQNDRFSKDDTAEPSQLANVPTRRIITAERSTIEASKNILGLDNSWPNRNQLGWVPKYKNNRECIKLNQTEIKYTQNPSPYFNHLGNYLMDVIGTYAEILPKVNRITKSEKEANKPNEQELAKLMLRYMKTGKSVSMKELKKINQEVNEDDINFINTFLYHVCVKEIARRMPCKEDKYDIPVAVAQARAIKLIAAGYLTIDEVCSQDAPYGVVTGEKIFNNHSDAIAKIKRINRLYDEKILHKKFSKEIEPYLEKNPDSVLIASRRQLHNELKETYGGESDTDTDSDGYSSSEDQQKLDL